MGIYDIDIKTIDGKPQKLEAYRGKTLLVVNVASKCGFTPQYEGLQKLYDEFKDRNFAVLGFPCDQFGHQEPGTEADIQSFCSTTYNVTFPMFAKINVNGSDAHPLYNHLKSEKKGLLGSESIKWNFTKFLVGPDGSVIKRYAPTDTPASIREDVAQLIK
jgi:glutathione peroxidase